MTAHRRAHRPRELLAFVLTIAFVLRAMVPQGFMPGSEWLSIELCPSGLSSQALATLDPHAMHAAHAGHMHSDHGSSHRHVDQCPFGLASLAMVLPDLAVSGIEWQGASDPAVFQVLVPTDSNREYRPQPRGPPTFS